MTRSCGPCMAAYSARATSTTSPSPTAPGRGSIHVGLWTAGAADILHICDVMATSGWLSPTCGARAGTPRHFQRVLPLCARPGRPSRRAVRLRDYLTVDPDLEPIRWSLRDPQRQTLWGHPAPRSWFSEERLGFRRHAGAPSRPLRRSRWWRGERLLLISKPPRIVELPARRDLCRDFFADQPSGWSCAGADCATPSEACGNSPVQPVDPGQGTGQAIRQPSQGAFLRPQG